MILLEKLISLTSSLGYYHIANVAALKFYLNFLSIKNKSKFSDLSKTIIITGSPRSGTTWLVELYQKYLDPFYIHEPLFKGRTQQWDQLNLGWEQFFPDDFQNETIKKVMKDLLSGVILNPALVQHNKLKQSDRKQFLMTKFVRGNLLLPWLTASFPFVIKPVYVIRHPCAVISSMLKHEAWNYRHQISFPLKWKPEQTLFSNRFHSIVTALPALHTVEELFALQWCLNAYPVYHSRNNQDWHSVAYEDLIQSDTETLRKIGLSSLPEEAFNKASFSALDHNQNVHKQISKWKQALTHEQIERIFRIIRVFNIKLYQKNNEYPDKKILLASNNYSQLFRSLSFNS